MSPGYLWLYFDTAQIPLLPRPLHLNTCSPQASHHDFFIVGSSGIHGHQCHFLTLKILQQTPTASSILFPVEHRHGAQQLKQQLQIPKKSPVASTSFARPVGLFSSIFIWQIDMSEQWANTL